MDGTGATGLFIDSLLQGTVMQKNMLTTGLEIERKSPEAQDGLVLLHPLSCVENISKAALYPDADPCNIPKHLGLTGNKPYFEGSAVKVGKQNMQLVLKML